MNDTKLLDMLAGGADDPDRALGNASDAVRTILERALAGNEVSRQDGEVLFSARDGDIAALAVVADAIRKERVGDDVTFVVTRNINPTNVCYMGCRFCGFAKRRDDPDAQWISLEEVAHRAQVARDRGATEVCIQGGLNPAMPADYYRDLVRAVKQQVPEMHIHAFSPFEIWFGAHKRKIPIEALIQELKDEGLGSMPGTAAEILDTEVRQQLTRNKLSADAWVKTIRAAHAIGMPTTSTIMYGHIDGPRHWAAHIDLLRTIQKETGGFTEFVPLGFVHAEAPLFVEREIPGVRAGATAEEHLKMHAVARIMLAGWIDNIQVSWVKLGTRAAQALLNAGVNDLGGTLMDESISRSAGASYGEEVTPAEMVGIIRGAGRNPVRRGTLYQRLEDYRDHDPRDFGPLKPRAQDPVFFIRNEARGVGAEVCHG